MRACEFLVADLRKKTFLGGGWKTCKLKFAWASVSVVGRRRQKERMAPMPSRVGMPPPWGMSKPLPRGSKPIADADLKQAIDMRSMATADALAIERERQRLAQVIERIPCPIVETWRSQTWLRFAPTEQMHYTDKERKAQLRPLVPAHATGRVPLPPHAVKQKAVVLPRGSSFYERDRLHAASSGMLAKYSSQYKRRMLEECRQTLSTTRSLSASRMPIRAGAAAWGAPDRRERLSSTPTLSLYESERLLRRMEEGPQGRGMWKWPKGMPTSRPTTLAECESIGRLEPLLHSPAAHRPISRPSSSPTGTRESAISPGSPGSVGSPASRASPVLFRW